jgi:hypothetical protein
MLHQSERDLIIAVILKERGQDTLGTFVLKVGESWKRHGRCTWSYAVFRCLTPYHIFFQRLSPSFLIPHPWSLFSTDNQKADLSLSRSFERVGSREASM